jgi:O-antigen/teichoic acid export membrane protein
LPVARDRQFGHSGAMNGEPPSSRPVHSLRTAPIAWTLGKLRQHMVSLVALAIRVASVIAGFAVTYIIGRTLGPEATGQFAVVSQTAVFLATAGVLGLDISVVRHFSKAVADKTAMALRTILPVVGAALGLMVLISAMIWLGGETFWAGMFGSNMPTEYLPVLCVLLIGRGGAQLYGGLLRSQHRFHLSQIVTSLLVPALTALALLAGWVTDLDGALWASAIAATLSLLLGVVGMAPHISRSGDGLEVGLRPILQSSLPLWGVGVAMVINDWYGLYIASTMLSLADAGLYRVAVQIAAVMQVVAATIFTIYSAQISTAYHAQDRRKVALLARSALRVSAAVTIPMAIAMVAAGPFLLDFIGPEFSAAIATMYILIAGQVAYTLFGQPGLVLAMAGKERLNLIVAVLGTLLLLVAAPVGASLAGLEGIAIAISLAMVARVGIIYLIVLRTLRIDIWRGRYLGVDP